MTRKEILEKTIDFDDAINRIVRLEEENAELRKVAEFQQSSNMSRHFENKKLKEGLAVGSTFNKALNSMNKNLVEERDKYRDMVFDLQKENAELKKEVLEVRQQLNLTEKEWGKDLDKQIHYKTQFSKAKELLKRYVPYRQITDSKAYKDLAEETEQFLSEVEK